MFYLDHRYGEQESAFLRSAFGAELPGAALPSLDSGSILGVRGDAERAFGPDASLWLDAETASWAILEGEERALAERLRRELPYGALVLHAGRHREAALLRLLEHLWRAGVLQVDGRGRWPRSLFARGPLFRASYLVEIHLTSRCNMACRYCFAEAGPEGIDLPDDLAHRAVELALELPTDDLTIEFAGGEPLLRSSLLERLIQRCEQASVERDAPVSVAIETNGVLLTDRALASLRTHPEVAVSIGLDGPRDINDFARCAADGSSRHSEIEAAARAAASLWGKEAGALVVVHSRSWSRATHVAGYLASLGLGKMRFNPVAALGRAAAERDTVAVSPKQYLCFMQCLLDYLAQTRAFEESNLEALVRNLALKTRDYRCMRSPCGAGYDYLVVDAAGDVYPCARFVRRPELRLGNVADGGGLEGRYLNSPLVRDMADRIVSRIPACQDCVWRHFCEAGCALAANAEFGTLSAPDPFCDFYRGIYPYLIGYLYEHPEMVEHFFAGGVACRVAPPASRIAVTASEP